MGIKVKTIKIKWHSSTKKYYISKGYKFTRVGDEFEININDLNDTASTIIECECDRCGEFFNRPYYAIKTSTLTELLCKKCSYKYRNKRGSKHKKEDLKNKMLELINTDYLGEVPSNSKLLFIKGKTASFSTYKKAFGVETVIDLLDILEVNMTDEERNSKLNTTKAKMTKEEVRDIILKKSKKLNRPLFYDDFRNPKSDEIGISLINKFWGSMNKMKKDLGLDVIQEDMVSRHKSKECMLEDLQKLIDELGRVPTSKEVDKCEYTNESQTYARYFGGLSNAIVMLGYIPNKKCISLKMTNEEVKDAYKEFIEENGYIPSYGLCTDIYELPAPMTVIRRFNCSWNEFIVELGYEPNRCVYNPMYAKDNTRCNSTREAYIHNYILDLGVKFEKEVLYSDILDDENLKEESKLKRLDWVITYKNKQYYLEYFGMMGIFNYDERHNMKIDWITKDNKLDRFIAIYPNDLNKLDDLIKNKIIKLN